MAAAFGASSLARAQQRCPSIPTSQTKDASPGGDGVMAACVSVCECEVGSWLRACVEVTGSWLRVCVCVGDGVMAVCMFVWR